MKRKNREPESVESRGSGGEKAEASKKGGKKKRRRQEDEQQPAQGGNDHVPSTCTDSTCELCGDGELEISVVVRRDLGGGSVEYGGADDGDDLPSATDLLKLALSEKSVYERARDADYPLQRPGSGDDVRGARDPTRADRESHRALVQKLFETAQEVFDRGVSRDVTGQLRVATPTDLDAQRLRATCVRELGAFVRSGDVLDDAEKAYEEILEVAMPEGLASEDVARWESRKVEAWGGLWRTTMEKLMVKIEAFLPYANEESDSDEHETNPSQQHASGAAVWIDADEAKLVEKAIASLDKSITALPTDSNSAHLPRLLRESCAAARAMQEYWLASGGVSGRRAKRARGEDTTPTITGLVTQLTHPLRTLKSSHSDLFFSSPEARFLLGRGILLDVRKGPESRATSENRRKDLGEAVEHLQAAAEAGDVTTAWNWLALALLETVPLIPPEDDMQAGEVLGKAVEALAMALEEDPGNEEARKMLMAIEVDGMEGGEGEGDGQK